MTTQDMDILARKIVSLEKRHNSLARAQQLPNSSVRIVDGEDVGLSDAVESVKDTSDEAAYLGEWLYDADGNIDNEAEHSVEIPDWIQGAGHVGDVAWDSTQFATDLALQLETELGEAQQELEQAQIDLAQALADSATALQEAQQALQEAEDATTAAGNAAAAASAAQTAANNAQTAAGTAQDAADQAAADALAAANAASAAQGAADDAQTTADAKGKVIIQPGAPIAADRLPQNLWIDTTGGNNTPKRWDGNNWVVVTDKAATDAAAAAVTAQDRADDAYNEALSAATAAGNAQASADGKTTNWYQNDAPAGTAHKVGDTWFKLNDGNRVHRWNGSNWVTAQFGTNAISDTAINAAKLAANAVTEGKILNGAITNDKLNSAVQNAITTAQSTADNAQTVANSAQSVASAAQTAASNAQDDADQAIADALAAANAASTADGKAVAAQNTADAKGKVIIQSAAPAAADRLPQNLWIDTTGGANTPKRWVSGTTWAVVTDKAATDAAAAAVTAQNAATAAQSRADDAHTIASGAATAASAAASAASAAQTAANNAQTTANGKNKIVRSTADASSPGNYVAGDQWWKYSGSQITAMWIHSGSAWVSQTLTDSVITNLNAGTITAGTIAAARLSAVNIKAVLINAGAIETANIAAGAITAASGIIADAAIGTAKIIDGSITTAKIANLAVTNAEIANGTIQNAKIANLDAAKITTGYLAAARIQAGTIVADKLASGAVVADKIASNAVTAVKINANAVTAPKIAAGAVIADKIASNAVTADKIAANAITAGKIQGQAIDGMTITGALIRTAPTGQRIELDVNGWHGYDSTNSRVSLLDLAEGRLELSSDTAAGGAAFAEIGAGKLYGNGAIVHGIDQGDGVFVLSTNVGLPSLELYSQNSGYSRLNHTSLKMYSNGSAADGPQTDVTLERKRGGQLHKVVLYNPASTSGTPHWGILTQLGGTSMSRLWGDSTGQLTMQTYAGSPTTTASRPIAFAEAAGSYTSSLTVNSNSGRTVTFTYPSSRFTIGPILQCTVTTSSRLQLAVTGSTTTTATVRVDNFTSGNVVNTYWGINWHAIQRLVDSPSG